MFSKFPHLRDYPAGIIRSCILKKSVPVKTQIFTVFYRFLAKNGKNGRKPVKMVKRSHSWKYPTFSASVARTFSGMWKQKPNFIIEVIKPSFKTGIWTLSVSKKRGETPVSVSTKIRQNTKGGAVCRLPFLPLFLTVFTVLPFTVFCPKNGKNR